MTCPCPAESETTHWRGWGTVREGFVGFRTKRGCADAAAARETCWQRKERGRGVLKDGVSIHSPEREGSTTQGL